MPTRNNLQRLGSSVYSGIKGTKSTGQVFEGREGNFSKETSLLGSFP